MPVFYQYHLPNAEPSNLVLEQEFLHNYQRDDIRKTHHFNGRYENIYLTGEHIPQLNTVIKQARSQAEMALNQKPLRVGYWFNFMPPGAVTTAHRHDDYDELLSGVYYINVPENSGKLLLQDNNPSSDHDTVTITPQAGLLVFFKPDVMHEVTENMSGRNRLSLGMNFGMDNP